MPMETVMKLVLMMILLLAIVYFIFFTKDRSITMVLETLKLPGGLA